MVLGEDEDPVEPLPEGEVAIRQGLLAEEGPAEDEVVVFFRDLGQVVVSEGLACQVVQVVLRQGAAAGGCPLHVQGVTDLRPRHLVRHVEGPPAPLGERIVPHDSGESLRLLVAMDDDDDGQGERPELELELANLELGPEQYGELLVHHAFGSLLFCAFDLLQLQVSERHRHLLCRGMVFHRSLAVQDVPRIEVLLPLGRVGLRGQQLVRLVLAHDGDRHGRSRHVDVENTAH